MFTIFCLIIYFTFKDVLLYFPEKLGKKKGEVLSSNKRMKHAVTIFPVTNWRIELNLFHV
jgi:hypothetical protein